MIGDSCCAFVSLSLGKNELNKAKKSVGNAIVLTVVSSLILCIVYLIFCDPIFIFVFEWGMMGEAVTIVIGQLVTAILAVWYLYHMRLVKPGKADYILKDQADCLNVFIHASMEYRAERIVKEYGEREGGAYHRFYTDMITSLF